MKREIVDEVIACLPKERTLFYYFKGKFAFTLLSYVVKQHSSVSSLKRSYYGRLLNQPDVKSLLANLGKSDLSPEIFSNAWNDACETFVLTLSRWGHDDRSWDQVSRNGHNLVLQLNFSGRHDQFFKQLVKPEDEHVFNHYDHPVMSIGDRNTFRNTLSWSRIDIDFNTGEALIEEVQSDWVRLVKETLRNIKENRYAYLLEYCDGDIEAFVKYAEEIFSPYVELWAEAMLTATIEFIRKELGIDTIFYHTHECGKRIKRISAGSPPRSLYSDLPRRFCFQLTDEDPYFLKEEKSFIRTRKKIKNMQWYKLAA